MVSKTRDKLIEVARQLFANKGVENTTMSDIATASDKGRRTIYTYFKNKREIYNAVLERESERLVQSMREVADSDIPPTEKVRKFILSRIILVKSDDKASMTEKLRSLFNLDLNRIERIRKLALAKENQILQSMLEQGVRNGEFDPKQARKFPSTLVIVMQGLYYSYVNNNFENIGLVPAGLEDKISDFLVEGLKSKSQNK
ncbi:MAG: TetR/AcrR family transcriptional regulator [Muribaculaceae bacterium]|nr:TetR/AcrR family transcriptional regulator [Muribaculaceae bacterium]